jgi:hypothetical protein
MRSIVFVSAFTLVIFTTTFGRPSATVLQGHQVWQAYGWPNRWLLVSSGPKFDFFLSPEDVVPTLLLALGFAIFVTLVFMCVRALMRLFVSSAEKTE